VNAKRVRLLNPDGTLLVELDERDSKELRSRAVKANMSPREYLLAALEQLHNERFKVS
jgi:hypothetical protein